MVNPQHDRPFWPRIDNLLSLFLRRYFECLQQLSDFVLDRLIMILQWAAIFGGKRGMGFGLNALAKIGLSTCSRNDSHCGYRPQARLRGRVHRDFAIRSTNPLPRSFFRLYHACRGPYSASL